MIWQKEVTIINKKRGYHLITHELVRHFPKLPEAGILHIFLKHTSAGLTLNENADPSVRDDFEGFMNVMIPENHPVYTHTYEGADDMPAHLKTSVIGNSVTIPITKGRLNMGIWQGVYLCEFRDTGGSREIVITVYS